MYGILVLISQEQMQERLDSDGLVDISVIKNRYRDVGRKGGSKNLQVKDKMELVALSKLGGVKRIAEERGVSAQQVSNIRNGKSGETEEIVDGAQKRINRLKKRAAKSIDKMFDRIEKGNLINEMDDAKDVVRVMSDVADVHGKLSKSEADLITARANAKKAEKDDGKGNGNGPQVAVIFNRDRQRAMDDYEVVEVEGQNAE